MTDFFDSGDDGFNPPARSTADRPVAISSKGHFCGHVVIGDGCGRGDITGARPRVVQVESYLELSWSLCLSHRHDIADLREQVAFDWFDADGKAQCHFFDLVVTRTDGVRIACTVRPVVRSGGRFWQKMSWIAHQVRAAGFADDVRLLTDRDLDPVELHNAWLLHDIRVPDRRADAAAAKVVSEFCGMADLADLTARVDMGAAGFRALLRLVRRGDLRLLRAERITRATTVYKGSNS